MTMVSSALARPRRFFRLSMVQNALALYAAQFSSYVLPLVSIPYLTRVLHPDMWGRVALGQAAGAYVLLIVEYGFNYSATRDVARSASGGTSVPELVAGVIGARLALSAACLGVAFAAYVLTSVFDRYGTFFWLGLLWGVMLALRPAWYFLGKERVRLVTTVDVLGRVLGTLGIFVLVRGPKDAPLVLVMQILAALLSAAFATAILYREVAFRIPSIGAVRAALRLGLGFFMLQSAYTIYASSNLFIVGFVAPGSAVGFYAVAEKLQRAVVSLTGPATQAMYPRSSNLVVSNPTEAVKLARVSTIVFFASSVFLAGLLFFTAPIVIPFVFGAAYASSVPLLRVLAFVLIPVGMSVPLTSQWLYPLGFETLVARLAIVAGALHILLAATLVYLFSAVGAAYALVFTECLILSAIWFLLIRKSLNPFADRAYQAAPLSPSLERANHAPRD